MLPEQGDIFIGPHCQPEQHFHEGLLLQNGKTTGAMTESSSCPYPPFMDCNWTEGSLPIALHPLYLAIDTLMQYTIIGPTILSAAQT